MTRLPDCSAQSGLKAFTAKLRHVSACVRKTLTYDQGKEMEKHEELARRLKINVYFADPHSPWQRPTNENTNGLIREYLHEVWSASCAIAVSAPFAMSEFLSPQVWNAISILLKVAK